MGLNEWQKEWNLQRRIGALMSRGEKRERDANFVCRVLYVKMTHHPSLNGNLGNGSVGDYRNNYSRGMGGVRGVPRRRR